jgi:septal ring factor EnvC (AmiA/AmiB activator)
MMMKGPRVFMLAAALVLSLGQVGPSAHGDEGVDKKKLERIKREMLEKKKELKRADRKERSVLSELDKIDRAIRSGSAGLADQQKQLREAETGFREAAQDNAETGRKLAGLKRMYGQRLRALYKMSRDGTVAALSTDSLSGTLKRIKYLSVIAERDRAVMQEYGSALDRLTARQIEISEKKEDILRRKRTIEAKKAELEARKQKKAEILASVRKEKSLYEQTLRELEDSSTSLWAMIKRSEQEKKAAKAAPPSPRRGGSIPAGGARLPWPMEGQVLTWFGMQRLPQFGTLVFRRGIEIGARYGEAVRAVSDGEVVYADWYKGYGELIILDHGNGFYTLYGNLSRLNIARDARVARGQAIGLAGDTGSMKGSKLYFEIRRNGQAQDPLAWLARKQ